MTLPSDRLPPLSALRAFEAVARQGSLSRAAEELNITKSAVSHQLRALEADLGVQLLERGGTVRRAQTTSAGADLLASVQQALSLLGAACRQARAAALPNRRQVVKVSANPSLAALWLAPRIAKFTELYPEIEVQVFLHASQTPDWKTQGIDLAFLHMREAGPHRPAPGDIPLMQETVVPVCSPKLVKDQDRLETRIFCEHRWLSERHVDSPETDWQTWSDHLGLPHDANRDVLLLSGLSTVVAAAVAGAGIALGRSPLVDADLESGRLIALMPHRRMAGSWGYVMRLRPNRAADVALATLLEFLIEEGKGSVFEQSVISISKKN